MTPWLWLLDVARADEGRHVLFGRTLRLAGDLVEEKGGAVVDRVDRALEDRIGQVGDEVGDALDQADEVVAGAIGRVDLVMAARISQIDASANELVARSLGGVDEVSRKALARATAGAKSVVREVDGAAERRLAQADAVIEARVGQVDDAVQSAIAAVDEAAAERIAQLDASLERRLGNVDVIASKQTLLIEGSLLKVASLAATLAMLLFGVWPALRDHGQIRSALRARRAQRSRDTPLGALGDCALFWGTRAGAATLVALLLAGGARWLPIGSRLEVERLKQSHAAGMAAALRGPDLPRLRYHAAQLTILDPSGEWCAERTALEAELVSNVLAGEVGAARASLDALDRWERPPHLEPLRPLHDAEWWVLGRLGLARITPPDCPPEAAPDVAVALAWTSMAAATDRFERLAAGVALARALEVQPASRFEGVARTALAELVHVPVPGDDPAQVELVRQASAAERPSWSKATRRLEDVVVPARIALLDVWATPEDRSNREALRARRVAAADLVVDAFRSYDLALSELPAAEALQALAVDDTPLVAARWILLHPESPNPPPPLAEQPLADRVHTAPPRIAWSRRWLSSLPERARQLVGWQASERFLALEREGQQLAAVWRSGTSEARACAAAAAGLYTVEGGKRALSERWLPGADAVCEDGRTIRDRYSSPR